jgi:hypothetical protein
VSEIPDTVSCDVLVAGGGVAGVAAAASAARKGCSVILAERTGRLGGIGTRGMLPSIGGLFRNGGAEPAEALNGGMVRELVSALEQPNPGASVARMGRVFVLSCPSTVLEQVLLSFCAEQQGLILALDSPVTTVTVVQGRILEIVVEQKGTRKKVLPKAVVDCTGDGEVAFLSGAAYELSSDRQLAGFTVQVKGLTRPEASLGVKVPLVLAKAVEQALLPLSMRFTTFSRGDTHGEGYLKFSVDGSGDAGRDRQVGIEIQKAIGLLREQLPFFRDAAIGQMSGILQREGRRITGEYILTDNDVVTGRKFPDGVVRNAWPIELWDAHRGTHYRYPPENDHYEIPFRCLQVKAFSNLLTAGRCISVTHEALGSTRVMGTCMALGDIAGQAAAEMAMKGRYPDFTQKT